MMECLSKYLADWSALWAVRESILDNTGLRPRIYPAKRIVSLVDLFGHPTVFVSCGDSCKEDLLDLLVGLQRITIRE